MLKRIGFVTFIALSACTGNQTISLPSSSDSPVAAFTLSSNPLITTLFSGVSVTGSCISGVQSIQISMDGVHWQDVETVSGISAIAMLCSSSSSFQMTLNLTAANFQGLYIEGSYQIKLRASFVSAFSPTQLLIVRPPVASGTHLYLTGTSVEQNTGGYRLKGRVSLGPSNNHLTSSPSQYQVFSTVTWRTQ